MSTSAIKRVIAQDIALRYIGTFYKWGGDNPSGFDCSGFVIEILKSVGILPRQGDWSAGQLFGMFPGVDVPTNGCLVFYKNNMGNVIHVEYCITDDLAIGASGGGSKTLTVEDAMRDNAFIKIRPFNTRNLIAGFNDPFQKIL
jgi:peptidoglycan DL-endopeptidase CwlS